MPAKRITLVYKHKPGNNDILQREDTVKFTKTFRLRWYGHAERMQNQNTPKQITTVVMERKKEKRKTT